MAVQRVSTPQALLHRARHAHRRQFTICFLCSCKYDFGF